MFARIPQYDRSPIREQRSPCKYYCIDNGLRSAVLLPQSNDNEKLLENTVFMQLHRKRLPQDKITYYRGGGECDFVVQRFDSVRQLIQVSWDVSEAETLEREVKGLLEASKATGCGDLLIVTKDEERELDRGDKHIRIVPAWKWSLRHDA